MGKFGSKFSDVFEAAEKFDNRRKQDRSVVDEFKNKIREKMKNGDDFSEQEKNEAKTAFEKYNVAMKAQTPLLDNMKKATNSYIDSSNKNKTGKENSGRKSAAQDVLNYVDKTINNRKKDKSIENFMESLKPKDAKKERNHIVNV
ncbi:MAG: hypothetical protein RsTaC01_0027 [Candidatus Paraimprobicoccus trichonymphae]|uniref:Uncharacterized protein n=1 Tax=Candidatus Paraimprobicoccus trichonymphae TaxID=3033793 RepID=A0AA48KVV6_9FIRM|nr:MAG: hypothetical protein RsTaC01_0027 [Candidatus Paraimprobicoccus trichonymphae]